MTAAYRRHACWMWMTVLMVVIGVARPARTEDAVMLKTKIYRVEIHGFAFSPKTLSAPVGARVTWVNSDDEPHVVTSAGSLFTSSKALDTGDSFSATFQKPGTYAYYCSIHPMMMGTIIVQ
jgi:plastocyanin